MAFEQEGRKHNESKGGAQQRQYKQHTASQAQQRSHRVVDLGQITTSSKIIQMTQNGSCSQAVTPKLQQWPPQSTKSTASAHEDSPLRLQAYPSRKRSPRILRKQTLTILLLRLAPSKLQQAHIRTDRGKRQICQWRKL